MPRARDPNRDKAYEIWKQHDGEITNRAIAEQLGIDEKKIAVWKQRDKWNVVQQTKESVVQQNEKAKKPRYLNGHPGNKNPENKFTKRNQAARIHGLRAKYFNETQREIMQDFQDTSIADQLWLQIEIKFSAIIHMQKVMWVEGADDHLREESGSSWGEGGSSESFKISFAYEQYEAYIKAQTRAMAEYRNLVKQYLEITGEEDERRLKLENMQLSIEKSKLELSYLRGDTEDDAHEQGGSYEEALNAQVEDVFADEAMNDEEA